MRQRLNRSRQRMSKRMRQIDLVNFGAHMHTKYDVRKHDVPICMVNENRLTNKFRSVFSRKQNIAIANHFSISGLCVRRQSLILGLFVDT